LVFIYWLLLCSIVEFTIADWATLFGKEVMGMAQSTSALNYLTYLLGLIIGRFSIGWALKHGSEQFWIKFAGVVGGGGFIYLLLLSTACLRQIKLLPMHLTSLDF
jgi:sugar phosphate permease